MRSDGDRVCVSETRNLHEADGPLAEIVNLNKARKAAGRATRKRKAKDRRAQQSAARPDPDARLRDRELDGKQLDKPTDDA